MSLPMALESVDLGKQFKKLCLNSKKMVEKLHKIEFDAYLLEDKTDDRWPMSINFFYGDRRFSGFIECPEFIHINPEEKLRFVICIHHKVAGFSGKQGVVTYSVHKLHFSSLNEHLFQGNEITMKSVEFPFANIARYIL